MDIQETKHKQKNRFVKRKMTEKLKRQRVFGSEIMLTLLMKLSLLNNFRAIEVDQENE